MSKWKAAFFINLVVSICAVAFLFFELLDQGISYTYLEVGYDDQVTANEVLGNIIVKGGQEYSQKDFVHLLRQEYEDAFIVEEGNTVTMGFNSFVFENDRLVSVK